VGVAKSAAELFGELMADYQKHSVISRRGKTEFQEFDWGKSKHIVDEIDRLIGKHYGLSEEEIDAVISYDIKIRLGKSASSPDEYEFELIDESQASS